jgi:glycosyltransferase involved in cell wall biosynthesis
MSRTIVLCMSPARVAHEVELFDAVPGTELVVVTDGADLAHGRTIKVASRHLPFLGLQSAGSAALTWMAGLNHLDLGDVAFVASLELFALRTAQAGRLARRLGVPHVVAVFENLADNPLYRLPPWRWITTHTARHADAVICFTEGARDHAVALGVDPARCTVVHPGVDVELFHPATQPPDRPRVAVVAQLRADRGADKGIMDVVAACESVAADVPELELVIAGEGPLRAELEARRLPFLRLAGRLTPADVAELLRRSSVLVLASKRTWKWAEQLGFVLREAMATGLPIVGTRSGSIPEVVPEWNPLVAEGDVAGLADGIRAAVGPSGSGWGRRNREVAVSEYSIEGQGEALATALAALGIHL